MPRGQRGSSIPAKGAGKKSRTLSQAMAKQDMIGKTKSEKRDENSNEANHPVDASVPVQTPIQTPVQRGIVKSATIASLDDAPPRQQSYNSGGGPFAFARAQTMPSEGNSGGLQRQETFQSSQSGSPTNRNRTPQFRQDSNMSSSSPPNHHRRPAESPAESGTTRTPPSRHSEGSPIKGSTRKRMPTVAPSLSMKNDWYGTGARMEATKWKRWAHMVDKQTLGAHYSYIVGELSQPSDNHDQRQFDEGLAGTLTKIEITAGGKVNMATAFTDRSFRLREGRGAKDAMAGESTPRLTPRNEHVDCSCQVCKPNEAKVAGQPSTQVHYNKVPRCSKNGHPEQHPAEKGSGTFNSTHTGSSLMPKEDNTDADVELCFLKNMGRKAKPAQKSPGAGEMMPHRGDEGGKIAGQHNQHRNAEISEDRMKGRQHFQTRSGESPSRSGVKLVLSPQAGDPACPTQITHIRKADGYFKEGYSSEAERHVVERNKEMFRFANPKRARSAPPPKRDHSGAGAPSGEYGNHIYTSGNPLTMDGKHQMVGALNNSRNVSPCPSFRTPLANHSSQMADLMCHAARDKETAMQLSARMRTDNSFSELVKTTSTLRQSMKGLAKEIKQNNGHAKSTNLSEQLKWNN